MPFTVNRSNAIPVVEIEGKFLGSLHGDSFKWALKQCKDAGERNIVLDLSQTDFIDSSGIGIMIGGLKDMRERGGDIRIAGIQERIKAIFLMTKLLGNVFELFDNVELALASFEEEGLVRA